MHFEHEKRAPQIDHLDPPRRLFVVELADRDGQLIELPAVAATATVAMINATTAANTAVGAEWYLPTGRFQQDALH